MAAALVAVKCDDASNKRPVSWAEVLRLTTSKNRVFCQNRLEADEPSTQAHSRNDCISPSGSYTPVYTIKFKTKEMQAYASQNADAICL